MLYDIYLIVNDKQEKCDMLWIDGYEDVNYVYSLISHWNSEDPYKRKFEVRGRDK